MRKWFVILLFLSYQLIAFDPPDSNCSIVIKIINSRFDNLFNEEKIDTCCFVNRFNPNITWVIYPNKTEVPYSNSIYTIIILKETK